VNRLTGGGEPFFFPFLIFFQIEGIAACRSIMPVVASGMSQAIQAVCGAADETSLSMISQRKPCMGEMLSNCPRPETKGIL